MLQNSVHLVYDLLQIHINAGIAFTNTKKHLSYDQFSQLLLSAADAHNSNMGNNNNKYYNCKQNFCNAILRDYFEDDNSNNAGDNNDESFYVNTYLSHVMSMNKPIRAKRNHVQDAVGNKSGSNNNN
jgi:hypothetical protein